MKKQDLGRRPRRHPALETLESRMLLATTWYVDVNATGPVHDGTTWDQAFPEIQQALSAATAGDQVRVADGNYLSTVASRVTLKNDVSVLGGFAGSGAEDPDARDLSNTPSIIHGASSSGSSDALVLASGVHAPTIFDGFTLQSNGFSGTSMSTDSSTLTISHCVFQGGRGITNTNSAPTISNCLFDSPENGYGGGGMNNTGIFADGTPITVTNSQFIDCFGNTGGAMRNSGAAVLAIGCTFISNAAAHEGQIIYSRENSSSTFIDCDFLENGDDFDPDRLVVNTESALTLTGCNFIGNRGNGIGGIINSYTSLAVTLTDCVFRDNNSDYAGGAVYALGGGPLTITGCIFEGNSTYGYGGAVYAISQDVRITNSVFANNYVSEHGGGALYLSSGTATITNCSFSGNWVDPPGGVGGAIMLNSVTLFLRNCVLWGNTAGQGQEIYIVPGGTSSLIFSNSIVKGLSGSGEPFVRAPDPGPDGLVGTADDDYGDLRPRLDSSLINAGDNSLIPAGITLDVAGNPRIVDSIVDIGAYEYLVPLAVTAGSYLFDAPLPAVSMTFNGDVNPSTLSAADLVLLDPVTNLPLAGLPVPSVSYDPGTRTARWTFTTALPDGNYRAELPAGSVQDLNGDPLAADFTFDFFVLAADPNHDRRVNVLDLVILANNWLGTGKSFTQGDFSYDGIVDKTDLGMLAVRWQRVLNPPAVAEGPGPTNRRPPTRTPTRVAATVLA